MTTLWLEVDSEDTRHQVSRSLAHLACPPLKTYWASQNIVLGAVCQLVRNMWKQLAMGGRGNRVISSIHTKPGVRAASHAAWVGNVPNDCTNPPPTYMLPVHSQLNMTGGGGGNRSHGTSTEPPPLNWHVHPLPSHEHQE